MFYNTQNSFCPSGLWDCLWHTFFSCVCVCVYVLQVLHSQAKWIYLILNMQFHHTSALSLSHCWKSLQLDIMYTSVKLQIHSIRFLVYIHIKLNLFFAHSTPINWNSSSEKTNQILEQHMSIPCTHTHTHAVFISHSTYLSICLYHFVAFDIFTVEFGSKHLLLNFILWAISSWLFPSYFGALWIFRSIQNCNSTCFTAR